MWSTRRHCLFEALNRRKKSGSGIVSSESITHFETEVVPSDEDSDRLKSYENGANSFVRKPLDFAEFAETVARLGVFWLATNVPPYE